MAARSTRSKQPSAPRDNEPCPQPFSAAIARIRSGEETENGALATVFLTDPDAPEIAKQVAKWVRPGRGRPVWPPSASLPLLP